MIARPVSPGEVGESLTAPSARELSTLLLEEAAGLAESGHRVADLALWYEDGLLEVYARDEVETDAGAGGALVAEVAVGRGLALCLVCGRHNDADPRPWCSTRCRRLLRDEALGWWPEVAKLDVLDRAVGWAVLDRNARLGWHSPLTRRVAEVLYHRG